jgi:alpha-beta hydrolase superfamily lysophospholipase
MLADRRRTVVNEPVMVRLDITGRTAYDGPMEIATAVFVPDDVAHRPPRAVVVAYPGGTYRWNYYHLEVPGHPGYSLAQHLAAAGHLVVACDHLGIGDSTPIDDLDPISADLVLDADRAAFEVIRDRLATGTLVEDLSPLDAPFMVGVGHSMGGYLVTRHQGEHASFDAVGVLGWSQRAPEPPGSPAADGADAPASGAGAFGVDLTRPPRAMLHAMFHADDIPTAVRDADDAVATRLYPWAFSLVQPGATAADAAAIDTPVFVGLGERDLATAPLAEAATYVRSRDVTVYVVEGAAHCFNFASSRAQFYQRFSDWVGSVSSLTASS